MSEIEHVSDTAFWVAAYRTLESERPDAIMLWLMPKKRLEKAASGIGYALLSRSAG